jgi:hypothetical protein
MKTKLAASLFFAAGMVLACFAQEPGPWRFGKQLNVPPEKQEEIVASALDSDVYEGTREGFADLRVFDGEGAEVPYLLEKVGQTRTVQVRRTTPAKDVSLRELPEGGLEIQASEDPKAPPAEGVSLITPLVNYLQRVEVLSSGDGKTWQPLASEALIFDYSRYIDVANHDVPLSKNRHRRFRILVRDVTAVQESQLMELTRRIRAGKEAEREETIAIERRPFRIDRIEFWYNSSQEERRGDVKVPYPITDFKIEQNEPAHQTVIEVQSRREPLTALSLDTSSRNFQRRVAIQAPVKKGVRTEWHDIAAGTITRIDFRELQREEMAVSFPETRSDRYRIVIANGDNPALAVTGVRAEGNVHRLLFLAAPGVAYHLAYGSETAKAPSYDTLALRESLGRGYQPVQFTLAEQVTQPGVSEPAGGRLRNLLNEPLFLGGGILFLIALLAWTLYRAGRRIDQLPQG